MSYIKKIIIIAASIIIVQSLLAVGIVYAYEQGLQASEGHLIASLKD